MTEEGIEVRAALEEAARVLGLLAEPERLRIVASLVLGYASVRDIARVSGVDERSVAHALARLTAGGLVVKDELLGYRFAAEELKVTARLAAKSHPSEPIDAPPDEAKVLRSFIKRGRLTSIPAAHEKRLVVLDYLVQEFEPGKRYSEAEVNERLSRYHEDVAALRRYLVDDEFLSRDRATYWRSGGSVEIAR